jgi:hypothetical protein
VEETLPAEKGETLTPLDCQPAPLTKKDIRRIGAYVRAFDQALDWSFEGLKKTDRAADALLSIAVLHQQAFWGNAEPLLRLRALGAIVLAKMLVASCVGESRHMMTHGSGGMHNRKPAVDWQALVAENGHNVSRGSVFRAVLRRDLEDLVPLIAAAKEDLSGLWRAYAEDGEGNPIKFGEPQERYKDVKCNYGGWKWWNAACFAEKFLAAVRAFMAKPVPDNWTNLLTQYNFAVNLVHNGGNLLNKFAPDEFINLAVVQPQMPLAGHRAMLAVCNWREMLSSTSLMSKRLEVTHVQTRDRQGDEEGSKPFPSTEEDVLLKQNVEEFEAKVSKYLT